MSVVDSVKAARKFASHKSRAVNVVNGVTGVVASLPTNLTPPLTVSRDSGSTGITFAISGGQLTVSIASALAIGSSLSAIAKVTESSTGAFVGIPVTLNGVAAAPVAPDAPIVTLTPGDGQISIAWADGSNGGAAITTHTIYVNGTPMLPISSASPYVLTGLANGVPVQIEVAATNSAGNSPKSGAQFATPNASPYTGILAVPLAGQSNICGRYAFSSLDVAAMPANVRQYANIASDTGTYRTLLTNTLPLYHPENTIASNYYGPGNAIIREIALANPDKLVVAIPCGWGSTTLVTTNGSGTTGAPQWAEPSGNLNVAAVNQINAFMAANPTAVLHSIHWIQGENDAGGASPTDQATYYAALSALIAGWRTRITGNSSAVPFIIGSMTPGFVAGASTVPATAIQNAHKQAAANLTNVKYVQAPQSWDDGLHYTKGGARGIGVSMGRTALNAVPGTLFTEPFTGTDGASLTTVDWTQRSGTGGLLIGNKAYVTGTGSVYDAPVPVAGTNDYAVGADFTFASRPGSAELALRLRSVGVSAMTGYELRYNGATGAGQWAIIRFDGSSAFGAGTTTLGTYADNVSSGARSVRFVASGDTLKAIIDGVERISVTDPTYTAQLGSHGLVGKGTSSTVGIFADNYYVTTNVS